MIQIIKLQDLLTTGFKIDVRTGLRNGFLFIKLLIKAGIFIRTTLKKSD